MYVCACVRACACLIAFLVRVIKRTFEPDGNFTEREREREREGSTERFFRFFYLFCVLSCLVFFSSNPPSDECEGKEKKTNYHTENLGLRGAIPRNERKKQSLVVKSVKASVRSPLHDLAHREPQQHGSSCRRNLHLRAS